MNGNYSQWGNSCTVSTVGLTTSLNQIFTNTSNLLKTDTIFIDTLSNVEFYDFLIENKRTDYSFSIISENGYLNLNHIPNLSSNRIYEIQVRLMYNGKLQPYGTKSFISFEHTPYIKDQTPKEVFDGKVYATSLTIQTKNDNIIPFEDFDTQKIGVSNINSTDIANVITSFLSVEEANKIEIKKYKFDISSENVSNIYEINLKSIVDINEFVTELRNSEDIIAATPPYTMELFSGIDYNDLGAVNNPYAMWHIEYIQAPNAWVFMQHLTPYSENVGIVDFGRVKDNHSEFISPNRISNISQYTPCDYIGDHATQVGSVIAANPADFPSESCLSVGYNITQVRSHPIYQGMVPVQCSSYDYFGAWNEFLTTIPLTRTLNLSYGFQDYYLGPFSSYQNVQTYLAPVEEALDNNVMVFAATGNLMGPSLEGRGIGYPFGLKHNGKDVIGVGGTSPDGMLVKEHGLGSDLSTGENLNYNYFDFSLDPISADYQNQESGYLEITAPGEYIDVAYWANSTNPNNDVIYSRGTSFASPIVATIAGVMNNINSSLTNDEIRNILFQTADKVNYRPDGLLITELNTSVSYSKGYTYSNDGLGYGGFSVPEIDYIMGNGRVNMLSSVMNAAGLVPGGFTVDNSSLFPNHYVTVEDINDHSYLYTYSSGTFEQKYEYDAILNTNGSSITFDGNGVVFELNNNSTFRIRNGASMTFENEADLLIRPGINNQITKFVVEENGILNLLNDDVIIIPENSALIIDGGILNISNTVIEINSGGTLLVLGGGQINLDNNSQIVFHSNSYACINPDVEIENDGILNFTASGIIIDVNPILNVYHNCLNPCDISTSISDYSGTGSILNGTCMFFENVSISNVDCTSPNSGSISLAVIGGTPPYAYQWDDINNQTTAGAINLLPGIYNVTVIDDIGDILTGSFLVEPENELIVTISKEDIINCNSLIPFGSAFVSVSGGTPPYSYQWNDPLLQTTSVASNLVVGLYNVTISDLNGCFEIESIEIEQDADPIQISLTAENVSCYGGSDGAIAISITGGLATSHYDYSFIYTIDNSTGFIIDNHIFGSTNLQAGSYSVWVKDDWGCYAIESVTVNEPATEFLITLDYITDVTCLGGQNGSISVSLSGGDGPYSINWNDPNFSTSEVINNLQAGNYTISATDANGCAREMTYTITEPSNGLVLSVLNVTDVGCNGLSNGSIEMGTPTGGTPPYIYEFFDEDYNLLSSGALTLFGLSDGNYIFRTTDGNGNCAELVVTVSELSPIILTTSSIGSTCDATNDGEASVFTSSGIPPYSYQWDDPSSQTTSTATGLFFGNYSVTVTDIQGCSASSSVDVEMGIYNVPLLQVIYTPSCFGEEHIMKAVPQDGIPPYTYLWNDADAQTTQTISFLHETQPVSVTVTDALGCTAIHSVNRPIRVEIDIVFENIISSACNVANGQATAVSTNSYPPIVEFLWNDPLSQTTATATGLFPGDYQVTATDYYGCTASFTVTIEQNNNIEVSVFSIPGCSESSAYALASGGTSPLTYQWNDPLLQTTPIANHLSAGTYQVVVSDANSCTISENIYVDVLPQMNITLIGTDVSTPGGSNGSIDLTVTDGYPPYSYLWSNGFITEDISGLFSGIYSISVTDDIGCVQTETIEIFEPSGLNLSISSTFVSCEGCDATAEVECTNCTYPITYQWDDPNYSIENVVVGLCSGIYNVTVTDANGYTGEASIEIENDPTIFTNMPSNLIVNSNQMWTGPVNNYTVDGFIEILPNNQLDLSNCELQFGTNSGIIVYPGANLVISESILRGLDVCDNPWEGIIVLGDKTLNQISDPYNPANPQGFVHLKNNSVIEDAIRGVSLGDGGESPSSPTAGGIIWMDSGAKMLNNRVSVCFKEYDFINYSRFQNCYFEINASLFLNLGFVYSAYTNGLHFNNVEFKTNLSTHPFSYGGIFGSIHNAIIENCDFINLSSGIRHDIQNTTIEQCNFDNVRQGIVCWTSSFATIKNNSFINIPSGIFSSGVNYDMYGLYMIWPSAYDVNENTFNGLSSIDPYSVASYGAILDGYQLNSGIFFNNDFFGTDFGLQSQGKNTSMKVRCNFFNGASTSSMTVLKNSAGQGEFRNQGSSCINDGDPAGNEWVYNCSYSAATEGTDIFVENDIDFIYYSYLYNENSDPYTIPSCSSEPWRSTFMMPNICGFGKSLTSCDEPFMGITVDPNEQLPVFVGQVYSQINQNNSQRDLLETNIDNGNTQYLLNLIYQNNSHNNVRNALLNASPYLSDEVLIAAISEKPTPLPNGHVMQIIIANSPVTDEVYSIIENKNLPNGIKKQIDAAQTGISERLILEKEIERLNSDNQILENELVKAYIANDQIDNAKDVLENSETFESKKLLNDILIEQKDYQRIRENSDIILSNSEFDEGEVVGYIELMNCIADLIEQDKSIFEMNESQEQLIRDIAINETFAGLMSQSILMTVFGEEFERPISKIPLGGTKNMIVENESNFEIDKISIEDLVYGNIYPNPNNGLMYLEYQLYKESKGEILIFNVTGEEILRLNLEDDRGVIQINDVNFEPGVYLYKVISNGTVINTDKLIIY